MCEKCQAKFGNMDVIVIDENTNSQFLTGVGLGGVATVAGTKVIGRATRSIATETTAENAETISGGGAAIAGWFIYDRAKKPLWKGFGAGMMGAGGFVVGSGLIGSAVDNAVDSVFGELAPSDPVIDTGAGNTGLTAEQILLNALGAQQNNVAVPTGTGGTSFLF